MVLNPLVLSSTNLLPPWTPTHRHNSGLSTPATANTNGPSRRTHTEGGAEICKHYNLRNCTRGGGVQVHSFLLECRLSSSALSKGMPPAGCHW